MPIIQSYGVDPFNPHHTHGGIVNEKPKIEGETAKFTNFYENIKEARMRLHNTIVLYDGQPYVVLWITSNRKDNIFRVYMMPLGLDEAGESVDGAWPEFLSNYSSNSHFEPDPCADELDKWMKVHPNSPLQRKMMNSPKFNKFRPFPLGMCNYSGRTSYIERQPQRKVEQGLTRQHLQERRLQLDPSPQSPNAISVDFYSAAFAACITGDHPTPQECIDNLRDPDVTNKSAAFHRLFAFLRGPAGLLFLAYKGDIVGYLPSANLSHVRLASAYHYLQEVIADLNVFGKIEVETQSR